MDTGIKAIRKRASNYMTYSNLLKYLSGYDYRMDFNFLITENQIKI